MRRVASALDTGPASLYAYVGSCGDLRREMLDRVIDSIELEGPDPARWREQVHLLVRQLLDVIEAHPGIAHVATGAQPTSADPSSPTLCSVC